MRNEQIRQAWNGIKVDEAADARMRAAILTQRHADNMQKESLGFMKTRSKKIFIPIAASLLGILVLVGIFGNSVAWFGGKVLLADLGDSGSLVFHESKGMDAAVFAWDAAWGEAIGRELSASECQVLFGDLHVTGYAVFRTSGRALLHFEGAVGKTKLQLSTNGLAATDTLVVGEEAISKINGIAVTAGYSITGANSAGVRNIVYYASFEANGTIVYLERGAPQAESEAIRAEIADIVAHLTKKPPNADLVREG